MEDNSLWLVTQKIEEERLVSSLSGTLGFIPKWGYLQDSDV